MLKKIVIAAAACLAVGTAPASAQPHDTGIVRVVGSSAMWVSTDYLCGHPGLLPGLTVADGRIRFVDANGCDGNVCITLRRLYRVNGGTVWSGF